MRPGLEQKCRSMKVAWFESVSSPWYENYHISIRPYLMSLLRCAAKNFITYIDNWGSREYSSSLTLVYFICLRNCFWIISFQKIINSKKGNLIKMFIRTLKKKIVFAVSFFYCGIYINFKRGQIWGWGTSSKSIDEIKQISISRTNQRYCDPIFWDSSQYLLRVVTG